MRVCKKNSCLKSAYELYGIDLRLKVYTIDKETQNIDLNIGDYEIENGNIQPINWFIIVKQISLLQSFYHKFVILTLLQSHPYWFYKWMAY